MRYIVKQVRSTYLGTIFSCVASSHRIRANVEHQSPHLICRQTVTVIVGYSTHQYCRTNDFQVVVWPMEQPTDVHYIGHVQTNTNRTVIIVINNKNGPIQSMFTLQCTHSLVWLRQHVSGETVVTVVLLMSSWSIRILVLLKLYWLIKLVAPTIILLEYRDLYPCLHEPISLTWAWVLYTETCLCVCYE